MASSQSKGDGVTKSLETSSEAQSVPKPLRSMGSRGPLFNDLSEAFRQIAAKQGSKPSNGSLQDTDQQSQLNPTKSQKDFDVSPIGIQPTRAINPHTQDVALRDLSPYAVGRSLTDKCATPTNKMSAIEGQSRKVDEARMVDVPLDSTDDDGSKATQPRRNADGTTGRNEMRRNQRPSEPPQGSLPTVPQGHRQDESASKVRTTQDNAPSTDSTVSDSQYLLDADAQANELQQARQPFFPSPLRFPSKQGRKKSDTHDDYCSESSSANNTTESNLDPFQYDSQRYQAFMHSSNERDVSRALKRLSKVGEASEATISTPEPSPIAKIAGKQPATTTSVGIAKAERDGEAAGSWSGVPEKRVRDLQVQINRKPELEPEEAGYQGKPDRLIRSKAHLRLDRLARESTGDWVTEATSDVAFGIRETGSSVAESSDNEKENFPAIHNTRRRPVLQHPASKSQPESYELRDLKNTKQQVMLPKTKYSLFPANSDRLFSSGGKETSATSQSLPRNPFSRNSYKRADTAGSFWSSAAKGGSKYEFRDSASEYALGVQLGLPTPNPQDKLFETDLQKGVLGKYLKDSSQPSTEGFGLNGSERQTLGSSRNVEVTPRKSYEERHVDQMYPSRYKGGNLWRLEQQKGSSDFIPSSFVGEPLSSRSKFEFELLPLEEAQRKQKQQRESGESDETLPAEVRYQRARGSSQPVSSPIAVPLPAHNRRLGRRLSTEFSYESWVSLRDALQDTPSPFSATSRGLPTPSSGVQNRSLLHQHHSGMTTSDTSSTPTREFFGRFRPRMFSNKRQEQKQECSRVASDQTIIRQNNPLPHLESGLSLAGIEAVIEANISDDSRRRRARWFYLMATLSIVLPFFAILVLSGMLDDSLIWYTKGEVRRLTIKQRNFIRGAFLAECCIYVVLAASIIAVYTKKF
ncbi:hypothetical protein Hte_009474 [Hypoxylon texense]